MDAPSSHICKQKAPLYLFNFHLLLYKNEFPIEINNRALGAQTIKLKNTYEKMKFRIIDVEFDRLPILQK